MALNPGRHSLLTLLWKVTSYLLLSIYVWQITAGYDLCRTTRSISEYALTGHVISSHEGKRLETCVVTCELTQNCFSINYYPEFKRCELNNNTAEWYFNDLLPAQGALYLAMVIRVYTPCADQNPPCLGTCVPVPGSLTTRCVCEGNMTSCGNDSCSKPLGMEDGSVTDNMISVSSTHTESRKSWGRLHHSAGSWTPLTDNKNQWFQVNFEPEVKRIRGIATQGYGKNHWWVKTYYIMYKKKGDSFLKTYMENHHRVNFTGNRNRNDVVTNKIANPIEAVAVRIVPVAHVGRIALRIELYGCDIK